VINFNNKIYVKQDVREVYLLFKPLPTLPLLELDAYFV
jgi:hypothetical protein